MKRLSWIICIALLGGMACSHNGAPPQTATNPPVVSREAAYKPVEVPTTNDPTVPGHAASDEVDPAAADNSAINQRDRDTLTMTPVDQGNDEMDIKITASVRQAIVGDDSLSFNAKNVKIITVDGVVTLRGPVASLREKNIIGKRARSVDTVTKVNNELEVAK